MRPADVQIAQAILARGSKSFALAGRVLPRRLRGATAVIYAFCRQADDAIDHAEDVERALAQLQRRLAAVYAPEVPQGSEIDAALHHVVRAHALPQTLFAALLEGFAWDASLRCYETLDELYDYAARVAGSVGVIMALLMGRREPAVLARAADLGVAMQLTNIARDVGEDARAGRLYLPRQWLREVGMRPSAFLARPQVSQPLRVLVGRLLDAAAPLYARARLGIRHLPADCRIAVQAAALIYADIGRQLRALDCDSVHHRAVVSTGRKLLLLVRACGALGGRPQPLRDGPLPQTEFLVRAAAPAARAA